VVVLATFYPDDPSSHYGVVVAPTGRVHTFDLDYGGNDDIVTSMARAELVNWTDVTESWTTISDRDDVQRALASLGLPSEVPSLDAE
jgi:hypothetical protein